MDPARGFGHQKMSATKRCSGPCGRTLELAAENFHKDSDAASGYKSRCRQCRKQDHRQGKAAQGEPGRDFDSDQVLVERLGRGGEALRNYGHPIERASFDALLLEGSVAAAAVSLQLTPRQLRAHLSELERRAASRGWSPGTDNAKPVAEGFHVKGVSTYYNRDGEVVGQWVKSKKDEEHAYEQLLAACAGIADQWESRAEPVPAPADSDEDLLVVYPMGDPHIGMLAWADEAGENFDLRIAERQLYAAADHLVGMMPPAKYGLLINAGDFFHADNDNSTTFAGTPVDTDSRYTKVYEAGVRLMRRLIERMLAKHEFVHVINEIGNHDRTTSLMLAICLKLYFEDEPRVTIDTNPEPFHWYRFGKVLIGTHHGDRVKHKELGEVMACDRAKDWGETHHRHFYVGHVHHDTVKELRGVTVETLRTLAAKDRWHHGQGYRSGRDMKADVWHREYGRRGRQIVDISLVRALSD